MADFTPDEVQEALRPIASLLSKSEKAQRKLAPGTWQHRMLEQNIRALRLASALMSARAVDAGEFTRDDLREAIQAIRSMIGRAEKAQAKFSPGTSQHTLQRNRLRALHIAEELVARQVAEGGGRR